MNVHLLPQQQVIQTMKSDWEVRDTLFNRVQEVASDIFHYQIQEGFQIALNRVVKIYDHSFNQELKDTEEALLLLSKIDQDVVLTESMKANIVRCLEKIATEPAFAARLKPSLAETARSEFERLQDLFGLIDVEELERKINAIDTFLKDPSQPFSSSDKLTAWEVGTLSASSSYHTFLQTLCSLGFSSKRLKLALNQWARIDGLAKSRTMEDLNVRILAMLKQSRMFVVSRSLYLAKSHKSYDFISTLRHLIGGDPTHIGFFLNTEDGVKISHMMVHPSAHGVHPMGGNPLIASCCLLLDLDISSLISSLPSEHQDLVCKKFSEALFRYASIEHSDVPLTNLMWGLRAYLIGYGRSEKTEIDFKPNQPEICAGYVAKVFLQAIDEVNKTLESLGYALLVPFGSHENISRMTIERVIEHFNRLGIVKAVSRDPILTAVLPTPLRVQHYLNIPENI